MKRACAAATISAPTPEPFPGSSAPIAPTRLNDILNVADPIQQGFGYFVNVGSTRRQGIEAEAAYKTDKYSLSASYAYIDATFLNSFTLASNSPAANAAGLIQVNPGNQIPMIPHHRLKFGPNTP